MVSLRKGFGSGSSETRVGRKREIDLFGDAVLNSLPVRTYTQIGSENGTKDQILGLGRGILGMLLGL